LPVEIVEYRLNEDEQNCPNCGEELHEMGKEVVREELKIIPAQAVIVQHVRYTYSCRNCERTGTEVPVIKAPVKNAVIKGGFASPEAVAYVMTQKYLMDIPLYRQENDLKEKIFNKPEDFFTLERIRQGYKADRHISLWEIMDKILGRYSTLQIKGRIGARRI